MTAMMILAASGIGGFITAIVMIIIFAVSSKSTEKHKRNQPGTRGRRPVTKRKFFYTAEEKKQAGSQWEDLEPVDVKPSAVEVIPKAHKAQKHKEVFAKEKSVFADLEPVAKPAPKPAKAKKAKTPELAPAFRSNVEEYERKQEIKRKQDFSERNVSDIDEYAAKDDGIDMQQLLPEAGPQGLLSALILAEVFGPPLCMRQGFADTEEIELLRTTDRIL